MNNLLKYLNGRPGLCVLIGLIGGAAFFAAGMTLARLVH
jgi:hypothetical protein